jgi:integrase
MTFCIEGVVNGVGSQALLRRSLRLKALHLSFSSKGSVYKWLRPLLRGLGIEFTAHIARHYGGKLLNRTGSGLKTIMGALDHKDAKNSLRYQDIDREVIREAMARSAEVRRQPLKRAQKSGNGSGNAS